ncbi:group II intron maturase-specific domain-containing protein [Ligilactobacillus acidipiscis]|uniref:group II intron maturase-specific domain-containing protein n=1 Tax=Ligilactobacillus acidipiscis TaxID=89059 RepID=UPI0002491884|nr:group II intron maturase-specific domain-containing protein [Ligilactobacillus acidipiscis]
MKRITKRNRGINFDRILHEIKQKIQGGIQYYSIGKMKKFLEQNEWLLSRIRQYTWKQWKNIRTHYKALIKLGMTLKQTGTYVNFRKEYWRNVHSKTLCMTVTIKD